MIDIQEIRDKWLKNCGVCDFGLVEFGCTCPAGDARWLIQQLCDEVEALQARLDRVSDGRFAV